jgi:hypothetical protein
MVGRSGWTYTYLPEKCGMCDGLGIGCYDVVVFIGEVDISRTKTSQYVLYEPKR